MEWLLDVELGVLLGQAGHLLGEPSAALGLVAVVLAIGAVRRGRAPRQSRWSSRRHHR